MEKFTRMLLMLSVILSMVMALFLTVSGVILLQCDAAFSLMGLLGVGLCLLGIGILVSMLFAFILPRK